VNHSEQSTETPFLRTGMLRVVLPGKGCGARSRALLTLAFAALALSLSADPAAASSPITFAEGGSGAGQVDVPFGTAVDQTTGTVYVADAENQRIDEFDASGHFIMAFGWGVLNGAEELQTCTNVCERGLRGEGAGQMAVPATVAVDQTSHDVYVDDETYGHIQEFSPSGEFIAAFGGCRHFVACPIAIDSSGDLWVGGVNEVSELSSSGTLLSQVSIPGIGDVASLAVDSSGDLYVIGQGGGLGGLAGVHKFTPSGEPVYTVDELGEPHTLALDGSGDLIVGDGTNNEPSTYQFFEFDAATGEQTEAFGIREVLGRPEYDALAFGDVADALYVAGAGFGQDVQLFTPPTPGPLVQFDSTQATGVHQTIARLNAAVNPEHKETTVHFEYLTDKQFKEDGGTFGTGTLATPESASIGEGFSEEPVSSTIADLEFETAYRFRVVATNSNGTTTGEEGTFTTLPPMRIESTSSSEVTATSATLEAEINPLGEAAAYHFEYLTEAAYLEDGDSFSGPQSAVSAPQPNAALGSGEAEAEASQHIQDLSPNTVYRYRVVGVSSVVPDGIAGPTLAFTTQGTGGSLVLPDGREWELVSPPDKHGALILPIFPPPTQGTQAAAAGGAMAYMTTNPTEAGPAGNAGFTQVLSARGPGGWSSRDLSAPHAEGVANSETVEEDRVLSSDLSLAVAQPLGAFNPSLSEEASEQTGYLRTDYLNGEPSDFCTSSCYRPLVTGAPGFENVPEGTIFGDNVGNGKQCPPEVICGPQIIAATPDLSHIVLYSKAALTTGGGEFYEWSGGQLQPVPGVGQPPEFNPSGDLVLPTVARNAISADGSRVYFDGGVRVNIGTPEARTVLMPGGSFEIASAEGSRAFVLGNGELSEFNLEREASVPLAFGVLGVIGAAEDGSSVYFVSDAKLAPGALEGTCIETEKGSAEAQPLGSICNLYVYRGGETKLIAVLSGEDSPDWGDGISELIKMTARVSPDGGWLAFMSDRSLTGYDNRDAVSGMPDEEVYLYDANDGRLVCASCNPTGARPHGIEVSHLEFGEGLVAGAGVWAASTNASRWLAANVPGWTSPYHQSRYLSDGGRLFFNSSDALVPQDTNDTEDVYEYEPPGGEAETPPNDSCITGSATYSPRSQGCVSLISSGTSPEQSAFLDASETGNDVFFLTAAKLSALDVDSALDVYDAHVCSAFSPCPPPPPPPPACEGDACQSPVAAPEDPTPGSLTFQGPGNPTIQPTTIAPKQATKKKTIKCRKGKQFIGGRCVKHRAKKHKAKKANSERRAKS
jgi:WD40-like Beta Propeller Repeat